MNGNNYKPAQVGYGYGKGAGSGIITVAGLTRNAGSDTSGSWLMELQRYYILKELKSLSKKTSFEIDVGTYDFSIKNPSHLKADELEYEIADRLYQKIRECDTDLCDIAENLGFKADNIKKVKDYVFYSQHKLDR